ncbi:3'(2'),5'-bisphosphate nucleotidase CysQ [Sandaracinobacter sp. RS1-74]|uniref:3'(2'),5'-bisphosphate nucleotidase CysQ family protein n=1 Tax=Sandaracinobacteroides sayramensis TaxID=2913411 RepID=UPI001EDB87F2|nr:3'(2'),5'-bisphosphate nucleotidase CysQ [Sandaracinobacteroides sayramensis]MCG2840322.1 3'(2'),5'-bisphosphate nucleotidase CysQ [Sandaracinobacteroides sayramensis]
MTPPLAQTLAHAELLERLTPAMHAAGDLIERHRADGIAARDKAGANGAPSSPVTDADEAAEALLAAAIRAIDPQAVIVGEEAAAEDDRPEAGGRFWLIDPLDGTRDYVDGGTDYSVNIGLVEDGVPTLGLVLHPPSGTLWTGATGLGAWKEAPATPRHPIRSRPLASPPLVVTSRSHLDPRTKAWVEALGPNECRPSGSSLKFCLLAEGSADIYPRYGQTSEWDTAAADAILRAAGGLTLAPGQTPLAYGKPDHLNTPFLALADPTATERLPPFAE